MKAKELEIGRRYTIQPEIYGKGILVIENNNNEVIFRVLNKGPMERKYAEIEEDQNCTHEEFDKAFIITGIIIKLL